MAKENLEEVITDLRKSLAWLDLVLATLNEGVLTLNDDLKIHFANDATAEILDINRIFLLGAPLWKILPLAQNGKVLKKRDYINGLKKDNIKSLSGTYSLQTAEKKLIVDVTFGYIPKINQIVLIMRDVTKLQKETLYAKLQQEIAVAANESKTFSNAMSTSLRLICSSLNWQLGHVYYVQNNQHLTSTNFWYCDKPRKYSDFRRATNTRDIKIHIGLPGRVLGMMKPALISDLGKDNNFPRLTEAKKVGLKSGVAFPVLVRDEIVAILEFYSVNSITSSTSLLQVMANIGTQLGRVIERNRSEEEQLKLTREQAARAEAELAKEQIQLSEIRYRTLIEQSTDAIQLVSPTGTILYTSESIKNVLGYTALELQGHGVAPYMHPDDLSYFLNKIQELIKIPGGQITLQYRVKHKDGSWAWLETTGVNHLETPNINALVGTFRNITDRKKYEEELRYQKTLLEAQREVGPEGVLVVSPDGKMVSYNSRFIEMWKFSKTLMAKGKDDLALQEATEQLEDSASFIKQVKEVYKSRKANFSELRFKDGRVFDRYGSPVIGEDGTDYGYVWFFQDITERKRLERQKDEFISIASHELKTPVTSIKSFGQVLRLRFKKEGNAQAAELLGKMDAQVDKLTNLIGDLLDVTKIETGGVQYNNNNFSFDDLISELVEEMQRTTEKHTLIQEGKTNKKIYADRERIGQVLTNLLSNAIKYSPHTDQIIIHSSVKNGQLKVCVRDFGVGIPEEKLDKVFERFFRISGPGKDTFPGLGLGLYISSEIIKRQGGKIWVESTVGKGSKFCFLLPLKAGLENKKR